MENLERQVLEAATQNFSLPHDVIQLPTGGLFYKNKQKTVKVGYLTANDENLIANAIQKKGLNLIQTLVRNKLYEHDLKVSDLLQEDIEAILLFLRNSSFGPEYKITLRDPGTGLEFEHSLILDELDIKKPNFMPSPDGAFEVKLPKTEAIVKIRPLTFQETSDLEDNADKYPQGRVAPIVTWRLNKQIVELNGSTDRGMIASFVEEMPIMDSKFIRNFLSENVPSIDLKRTVIAPSGEKVPVNVAFGVEFFRPFV